MKTKWGWDKPLAAIWLCILFFLSTFSLYSIIPREYLAAVTVDPDSGEFVFTEREISQTMPVNSPVAGMQIFFQDTGEKVSNNVHVSISGQESKQVFYDGSVSLAELPENGEAALNFSQAAVPGQDSHLVVTITSDEQTGFAVLCSEKKTISDGVLTVDGSSSDGSLVYRPSLLREYWSWRRVVPTPYFILCLLLIWLAFEGKRWYERKSGKVLSFLKYEEWWQQTVCGGFLLMCGVIFVRDAVYLGIVSVKPDCVSQIRRISTFSYTVMALMNLAVTGLISWIVLRRPPIEKVAAVSVLVISIFYMVAITPLSPPDESYHYHSAYKLSNYLIFQWDHPEMGYSAHFDYSEIAAHRNVSSAYLRAMTQWLSPGVRGEEILVPKPSSGLSYAIEYLPPALGLAIGRILNLNFFGIFYLGRLTNMIFFALCIYFAVKRIPRFKVLMALTALLPMTLHQAASYSYDTFINGMAFLFIASLIREYTAEGKMTRKDFLWLLIPGALLAPAKVVYSVMLLLTFWIPARRFGSVKRKWRMIGVSAAVCLALLVVSNFAALYERALSFLPGHAVQSSFTGEPYYSVNFLVSHPLDTVQIFWRTLKGDLRLWMRCLIGHALSGLSLLIPLSYVRSFVCLLVLSVVFRRRGEAKILLGQRVAFVGCFVCVILLTMFAMLIGWTAAGSSVVLGVQGRYFLPVLPLLCMAFSGNYEFGGLRIEKALLSVAWLLNAYTVLWVFNQTIA